MLFFIMWACIFQYISFRIIHLDPCRFCTLLFDLLLGLSSAAPLYPFPVLLRCGAINLTLSNHSNTSLRTRVQWATRLAQPYPGCVSNISENADRQREGGEVD